MFNKKIKEDNKKKKILELSVKQAMKAGGIFVSSQLNNSKIEILTDSYGRRSPNTTELRLKTKAYLAGAGYSGEVILRVSQVLLEGNY